MANQVRVANEKKLDYCKCGHIINEHEAVLGMGCYNEGCDCQGYQKVKP